MGWIAIDKEDKILREDQDGRPVQQGEEGNLKFILQEDFGHKVAIDLINGVVILGYSEWGIQNGTVEIHDPRAVIHVCEETNVMADLMHTIASEPDNQGNFTSTFTPLTWRPIWFTRVSAGVPAKVIGLQTTTPKEYGERNIKCMVSLFSDGRIGISG